MIKITAKHTVKENCIDELTAVLKELVEKSRLEEGCISYSLYKDIDNDNIYTIIEEWQNIESLHNHFQTAHFKTLTEKIKPYIKECIINKYEEVSL